MKDLTVWVCLALAGVVVVAFAKPKKTMVGGILQKGKKGQILLALTPVKKRKK